MTIGIMWYLQFNLDGADGLAHYWHDLGKDKLLFSKRQQGGGSVMIFAGFSSEGKSTIAFCDKRLDSIKYQQILEEHFLPFWLHPDRNVGPRFLVDHSGQLAILGEC